MLTVTQQPTTIPPRHPQVQPNSAAPRRNGRSVSNAAERHGLWIQPPERQLQQQQAHFITIIPSLLPPLAVVYWAGSRRTGATGSAPSRTRLSVSWRKPVSSVSRPGNGLNELGSRRIGGAGSRCGNGWSRSRGKRVADSSPLSVHALFPAWQCRRNSVR